MNVASENLMVGISEKLKQFVDYLSNSSEQWVPCLKNGVRKPIYVVITYLSDATNIAY